MKQKILIIILFLLLSNTFFAQKNIILKENIKIINEITNGKLTNQTDVFPDYYNNSTFVFNQFLKEDIVAPDKKTTSIEETFFENDFKFGKEVSKEIINSKKTYIYNDNGILKEIKKQNGHSIFLNIGKYGEIISKFLTYKKNSFGISSINHYDINGHLTSNAEIKYNIKGQITKCKFNSKNNTSKTKIYEYNNQNKLIKTTLYENFDAIVKIIPRRVVSYQYSENTTKINAIRNSFATGASELLSFSEYEGLTVRDKTKQEVLNSIEEQWTKIPIFYVKSDFENNINDKWKKQYIRIEYFNEFSKQKKLYTIFRKYFSKEETENSIGLFEYKNKLKKEFEIIFKGENLNTIQRKKDFIQLGVKLNRFHWWFKNTNSSGFPINYTFTKDIVKFYKVNTQDLIKENLNLIKNKSLKIKDLENISSLFQKKYNKIIDQTLSKIEIKKQIMNINDNNTQLESIYVKYPLSNYKSYSKKNLYLAYLKVYKNVIENSEFDILKLNNVVKIQKKMKELSSKKTKQLEKSLKREQNLDTIQKLILEF